MDADATSQNNRVTYSIVKPFKISWKANESMCFWSNVQVYLLVTSVLAENEALHSFLCFFFCAFFYVKKKHFNANVSENYINN